MSLLSDYVNTIPSKDQISKLVSRIQEIEVVRMNGPLLYLVLWEIAKALDLLADNAKKQVLSFAFICFHF